MKKLLHTYPCPNFSHREETSLIEKIFFLFLMFLFQAAGTGKSSKLAPHWQKWLPREFLSSWPSTIHQAKNATHIGAAGL